jgi:uncharacterized protein
MIHLLVFHDINVLTAIGLSVIAFIAGFIDSVVGGGGLIQIPALLIAIPGAPVPTLFGTNKIAAISGTSISAYQYSKRIKFDFRLLLTVAICAAIASFAGAKAVSFIRTDILKPAILLILIIIAVYTFIRKDLGSYQSKVLTFKRRAFYGSLIGLIVGFYDGFFGPGTGSFLVLGFVVILGFEFLEASAYSKVVNCVTNFSALVVFISQGNFLPGLALMMALFNVGGSIVGTKMALKRGNHFIRIVFMIIVSLMIIRYSFDIFNEYVSR